MKHYFFLALFSLIGFSTIAQERPNVILILADDMGYGDIMATNPNSKIPTPNLDKLVNSGINFTDAHSGSAVCTPTRYGILTGEYAFRSRMKKGVLVGYDLPLIPSSKSTVADLFKNRNYTTACIGKWHLGLGWQAKNTWEPLITGDPWSKMNTENVNYNAGITESPNDLGFDYSFVIPSSLDIAPYFYVKNKHLTSTDYERKPTWKDPTGKGAWYRKGDTGSDFKHEEVLPRFTEESLTFIENNADQPFFLYVPFSAPHSPWLPSEEFRGKSGAGMYGDFMMMVDAQVGKVISKLEELGIRDNTMIIFTSDNGANWEQFEIDDFDHEANYTRSGRKSDAWDGGHHVPFVVSWPRHIPAKTKSDALVGTTDFMATFAELLDIELAKDEGVDSKSFFQNLTAPSASGREFLVHHSVDGHFAIRKGNYKYVEAYGSGGWSLNEKRAKEKGLPYGQLYNISVDSYEKEDLSQTKKKTKYELMQLLQRVKTIPENNL